MRNVFTIIVIVAVIAIGVYNRNSTVSQYTKEDQSDIAGGILTSNDGLIQFKVPGHWKSLKNLNAQASLQAGNLYKEEYMIVITDSKKDFYGNLLEHAETTSGMLSSGVSGGKKTQLKEITLNGLKAVQCVITGTIDRLKVTYLHTTIEGQDSFHQVLTWTLASKQDTALPVFHSVLKTVSEPMAKKPAAMEKKPEENTVNKVETSTNEDSDEVYADEDSDEASTDETSDEEEDYTNEDE